MNSNSIIVRDYLSSLKEDSELDYLFPILLNVMGFRLIQSAVESKGQSQYGKDIIAVGKDPNGVTHKWYFELKGYSDKDITQSNYSKSDGIRESLIEAKDTVFQDSTILGFNDLPTKIVLVHNGILKANIRPTFEGFISREFAEGEFERWDIYQLTILFSKYLFNENLLADSESNRLLKKTLAFLDSPDNDFSEFHSLVRIQFDNVKKIPTRAFKKLFATLNLLHSLVFHYSVENKYLVPAKECSKFIVLQTWSWILENNLQSRKSVVAEFRKLLERQFKVFGSYFRKTFSVAILENGLYCEHGVFFEKIGYPMRCFAYLGDVIHYCRLRNGIISRTKIVKLKNKQKDLLIELIGNNSGFSRPFLDNHSIPLVQLLLFFSDKRCLREKDVDFIQTHFLRTIENLKIQKFRHDRYPELYSNINSAVEFYATGKRPKNYEDRSSILIAVLLELSVVFNSPHMFSELQSLIDENLSLQIADIDLENNSLEYFMFKKNLNQEYFVECFELVDLNQPSKKIEFEDFKTSLAKKNRQPRTFITDSLGLSCVRYLAQSYYKNEILPAEWRILFSGK